MRRFLTLGLAVCFGLIASDAVRWLASATIADETRSKASQMVAGTATRSVRDFGAKGDGTTDDSDAFQKAVDSKSGLVKIPRGQYRLTRPIVINLDKVGPTSVQGDGNPQILMEGDGAAFHFVGTHQGTADPETVKPEVWKRQSGPRIEGVQIVGTFAYAEGIVAEGTMQLTVSRVIVRHALHGIRLTGRNRNVIISDSHFYENRGVGILLERLNLHQINVTNCHVSYNRGGGIVVRESEICNLQIGSCDLEANMGVGFPAAANIVLDSTEGLVMEAAVVGCTIQHSKEPDGTANIRLIGRAHDDNTRVGNLTIADNVLSDVSINIHMVNARGVTIVGNTLWQGHTHDILAENCSNLVIANNLLDRSPQYRDNLSPNSIILRNCSDSTLNALHINGSVATPAALLLDSCRRMNVTNCTLLNYQVGGILLVEPRDVRVSDCLIRNDDPTRIADFAIRVNGGRDNMIADNLLGDPLDISRDAAISQGNVERLEK